MLFPALAVAQRASAQQPASAPETDHHPVAQQPADLEAGIGSLTQRRSGAPPDAAGGQPNPSPVEGAGWSDDPHVSAADDAPPGEACTGHSSAYTLQPLAKTFGSDRFPTVRVTGFFHLDAGWFRQDDDSRATLGDIQDGAGFRRARVGATGNVAENVSYMFEMEFVNDLPRFVDVWMNFSDVPIVGHVRVGRWRQPFGMDELTSVRELPFLERALPFALAPFRQTGIGAYNHSADESLTWALSGYRFSSDEFGNVVGEDGGYGLAGRVTVLPWYEDDGERLLHFGVDYSFNDPSDDAVRYLSPPEFFVAQAGGFFSPGTLTATPPFVDTGVVRTRNVNLFGLEAAAALARLYLQSEVRWAVLDRPNAPSETLPGAYLQARYVLTGEKLPYLTNSGVFGRIEPDKDFTFHGGCGAWELAARWSYLDLGGGGFPGPGRRLHNLALGVNWYLNAFTKFQLNFIRAFLDDQDFGSSHTDIFALRGQLDF